MGKDKEVEDSSSSSSDEDDDLSSDEEEEMSIDTSEIDRLEMQVRSHPYNFAYHEQYIAALSKAGKTKFAELRAAREDLSSKFPLPEGVWLAWLKDESQAATTKEEKEKVIELYKTALKDYLSVPLQISLASFVESLAFSESKGGTPDAASAKLVRDTYEQGLTMVGLHVTEGYRQWAGYRTFEQRVLASMSSHSQSDRNKQIERIRALYRRQVSVPHKNIEETYADFASWEASLTPPGPNPDSVSHIQAQYKSAVAAFEERKAFEEAVAAPFTPSNPDYDKLPAWREYLAFEESKGDPSRAQCLYERVLKSYFLVADLWVYYTAFLEKTFSKMPQIVYPVYARAVRNCTWSGDLWASYIRSLEKANRPVDEITGVFETALVSGIQQENDFVAVWNSFLDFKRRAYTASVNNKADSEANATAIREALQRYHDYFTQYFAGSASIISITLYWARLEANVLQDGAAARKQYGDYIHHHNTDYLIWQEWISAERRFGHPDMARQLYRRAAQITAMTNPDSQRVRVDWMAFEREAGDIDTYTSCAAFCASQEAEMYARMEKAAQEQALAQAQQRGGRDSKRKPADEGDRKNKRAKNDGPRNARNEGPRGARNEDSRGARNEGMRKRTRDDHNDNGNAMIDKTEENQKNEEKEPEKKEPLNVIHVSNLPWKVQEARLKEIFEKFGAVKVVRLPRQGDKSMGYAFVDFETDEAATAALSLDKTPLENRTINVALATNVISDSSRSFVAPPSSRRPHDPANSGESSEKKVYNDDNTLYLNNLPFSCTSDDVRKAFESVADDIREIRLATDSKTGGGRCKGFAYIEFKDAEGVNRALAIKGLAVKGRPTNMARAEPPKPLSVRQSKPFPPPAWGQKDNEAQQTAADENKPLVRRGMGVPRALKMKVAAAPKKDRPHNVNNNNNNNNDTNNDNTTTNNEAPASGEQEAPKSNDFFKNLMKKM